MRILGLDLGSKTCGIALSDHSHFLATGIETYRFKDNNYKEAAKYVLEFVEKNDVGVIVVGYPKNMDGTIGERGKITERFVEVLKKGFDQKIVLWDERLSTRSAHQVMISADVSRKKRKKSVDKIAATIILQNYLDSI